MNNKGWCTLCVCVCVWDITSLMSLFVCTVSQNVWVCVAVEDGEVFDFRGLRLDWFRLQVS